ncbi:MAG: hypothetical protein KatS3mg026_1109 [Bacteroidia bacterium]|nr:MAG: hypothetical protein KatS3mg026_1109 [Bacteroidia bacterium]
MKRFSPQAFRRAWGILLLWPGIFLYYAHWDYLSWLPAFGQAAVVLGVSAAVWGLLCGVYKSIERGSIVYIAGSFLAYLAMIISPKLLAKTALHSYPWLDVVGLACAVGVGVGVGIWTASRPLHTVLLKFFHFFSVGIFLLNAIGWPLYRKIKHHSNTGCAYVNFSPPLRSVYVLLLDEHPSPGVMRQVFPQADTFLFRLSQKGFFYSDSLWATPASTLHTLAKVYQVPIGRDQDSITDFGLLRHAGLLWAAQKKGYELKGLWPYYGPLQQLPIQWEGSWLFSSAFGHFPWTAPIGRWIKHRHDKAFVAEMKKIAGHLPDKPTFYHLHVFLTHAPYSTGTGGAWQPLLAYSLQERVRNATSYSHQEVLAFIDTLLATYPQGPSS